MSAADLASDRIELPGGGHFEVLQKLATGGMAQIYLARKATAAGLERLVVLKRILPHLTEDQRFVEMFTHEAKLAALLVHPNVAQVYDMGKDAGGNLYYAMEYVEGLDLRAIVRKRSRPLPLDVVLATICGAAAGLHYAHTLRDARGNPLNVVHRDVTPSNIMITFDGGVKVVDFGVAKAAIEGRESTAVGVLKGKVPYMSPEQITASSEIDGRSDVFSLGICLWELTTHRRLFRRESQIESIRAIADHDAPAPSSLVEDYPEELERIVLKALTRDRDARYASAREMQAELESFAVAQRMNCSPTRLASFMDEWFSTQREAIAELLTAGGSAPPPASDSSAPSFSEVVTTATPTSVSESISSALSVKPAKVALAEDRERRPLLPIALGVGVLLAGAVSFAVLSGDEAAADEAGESSEVAVPDASASASEDESPEVDSPEADSPELDSPEADSPEADEAGEDEDLALEDPDLPSEAATGPSGAAPGPSGAATGETRHPVTKTKKKKTKKAWNKNALLPPQ